MIRFIHQSEIEQGSLRWHELRLRHYPASEAGAVMGVNPWAPKNQRELFAHRTGRAVVKENPAMARGSRLEGPARANLSAALGIELVPVIAIRGDFMASLDGWSEARSLVAEIKVPMNYEKLRDTMTGNLADLPRHYFWQLVQQAYCSECEELVFSAHCFEGDEQIEQRRLIVSGDELREFWPKLESAWETFRGANHEPLEIEREDDEWKAAARAYSDAKEAVRAAREAADLDALEAEEKAAKDRLKELAGDAITKTTGYGVTVSTTETKGYTREVKPGTRTTVSGDFEP